MSQELSEILDKDTCNARHALKETRPCSQQQTKLCACKDQIKKIVVFEHSVVYFAQGGSKVESVYDPKSYNVTDDLDVLSCGASCEQGELPTKLQS